MKTYNANQTQKLDRPYLEPRYFVHILLPGDTLYFSDRNFTFNGHNYEDYLKDIPATAHAIEQSGGYGNLNAQLTFKNIPFRAYDYLLEFFDANPIISCEAEIYVLYINPGEVFESDLSTLLYRVGIEEFRKIKLQSFQAKLSSVIHSLDNEEVFTQINTTNWPNADSKEIGKYENIIYGSIRDVPCHCVVTGATSILFLPLDKTTATLDLSEVDYPMAFPSSGTVQIDDEKISYTGKSSANKTLTGCTRGASGTTAATHERSSPVWLVLDSYKYLVAGHVCKSAANLKSEQIRIAPADYTVDLDDGGKTTVTFTEKQLLKIQGMHSHPALSNFRGNGTSGSLGNSGHFTVTGSEANMRDQSEDTYVRAVSNGTSGAWFSFHVYFPSISGKIKNVYGCIRHNSSGITGTGCLGQFYSYHAGYGYVNNGTPDSSGANVTQKFLLSPASVVTELKYYVYQGPAAAITVWDFEMWLEYEMEETGPSEATGVWARPKDALAPPITIDVEGYKDDGSGTYTGSASALIENPSDVRRHFLMAILGRDASVIGTSFGTARTAYAARISGGYKFGMILSEIGKKPSEILRRLDEQSRSNTREEFGKFELQFNTSVPSVVKTITVDQMKGEPIFSQTSVYKVRNKIKVTYDIDWADSSIFTGWKFGRYKKQLEVGTGTKILEVELPAVQVGDMADDVADYLLAQQGTALPMVEMDCNAEARALEKGDPIGITYPFWSGFTWKILSITEHPERQVFSITARRWV